MELRQTRTDRVTTLSVIGRIDSTTAAQLALTLEPAAGAPTARVVLDLGGLEYISSAGFRVLLVAAKRSDLVGSRIVVCALSEKVREIFELGGFLELFTITATRDEAIAAAC